MTLEDQKAADSLVRLLETMRRTKRPQGRIEVIVDGGQARELRIIKISESERLQTG
jgi:hypothetical protein